MGHFLIKVLALTLCIFGSSIEGKVVRHIFDVDYFSGSPDGVFKDNILGINGQFPGPTIVADIGDTLEILVNNKIRDGQNTSIHWHGIHQKGSHFEDGTTWISQCPLKHGQMQLYTFEVHQAGTYWYHSHVNSQYTEGLWGILIVHNAPEVYQYDEEMTITLNDWYHRSAIENEHWHLSAPSRGVPPYPDSGMINGLGRFHCDFARLQNRTCNPAEQKRSVMVVQKNKTYRVRVINTSAVAAFNFSIEGHVLQTIEVDGIDVAKPVPAEVVCVAAAQRYSFLIKTDGALDRYLIRADLRNESLMLIEGVNINKYPECLMKDVTAVLKYAETPSTKLLSVETEPHSYLDFVPPAPDNPLYLDENALGPFDGIPAPPYFDEQYILEVGFYEDHENIRRGSFNQTPFVLPEEEPLLLTMLENGVIPKNVFPIEIKYMNVIQVIINNPFFGPHPFHLHGHHFWVLGTGAWYDGDYNSTRHNPTLTLRGAKRDTVLIQEQSWAVIRFIADNPGVWTFHCHIDWHNLSGMAMTFIEAPELARSKIKVTEEFKRVCGMKDKNDDDDKNLGSRSSFTIQMILVATVLQISMKYFS